VKPQPKTDVVLLAAILKCSVGCIKEPSPQRVNWQEKIKITQKTATHPTVNDHNYSENLVYITK
jgi:hypothetical protein